MSPRVSLHSRMGSISRWNHCSKKACRHGRRSSRGQAVIDYVVGCALVTALLAAPWPGGRSALDLLLDGIRLGYARLVTALAVPV